MTDRYENIRLALANGPTPGPFSTVRSYSPGNQELILSLTYKDEHGITENYCTVRNRLGDTWKTEANAAYIAACDPDTSRALLAERDQLAAALEAALEDGARLRETLRDVTGVAICGLFDTNREDTLREFSLQELARVTEVTAPLIEEGVTVESVYRRGYDAAIDQARGKESGND